MIFCSFKQENKQPKGRSAMEKQTILVRYNGSTKASNLTTLVSLATNIGAEAVGQYHRKDGSAEGYLFTVPVGRLNDFRATMT
jgi:hypothetical protein